MSQEKGEKKQEHCAYTMRIICKMLSESMIVEIKKTEDDDEITNNNTFTLNANVTKSFI